MTLIALDVMSGDLGAQECVPAALLALASDSSLRLKLVGQSSVMAPLLDAAAPAAGVRDRLELIEASEIITMTDAPREAIRRKKQSSMRIAADLVHDGLAEGMVSAGNTGALTAISHFVLKCLPEVERAPIMTSIPNRHAFTQLLDVGASDPAWDCSTSAKKKPRVTISCRKPMRYSKIFNSRIRKGRTIRQRSSTSASSRARIFFPVTSMSW
jgi:glycerol-3-phosphate acyltransferase PlsX